MCVLFCENANYNFADFPLGFLLGRLCGGLFVIYVFLVFYVIRTYVLSCLRWFEIADRVRNEGLDGFQVRWCFKIVVETAAGAVFLLIIKPKPWVRHDGLSINFHAGEPPTSRMLPHWACVAAEQWLKEK